VVNTGLTATTAPRASSPDLGAGGGGTTAPAVDEGLATVFTCISLGLRLYAAVTWSLQC
jgi:hypothetical protein